MENLEEKYIDLLLNRCIDLTRSNSLFISCSSENMDFVNKLVSKVKTHGIDDIYIDCEDIYELKDKVNNSTLDEIDTNPYFDKSIWNEYALKTAAFLMFESEHPGLLDDINQEKYLRAIKRKRETRSIFREKETRYEISWCIAALPNEVWAKSMFPNETNAYQKLFEVICKMCMVDKDDPIKSWNEYLSKLDEKSKLLTSLEIKELHYTNSLGTNLKLVLPDNAIWKSVAEDGDGAMIVNMPSYETFSAPDYRKTSGIVYSSRPLIYNGKKIDEFYLKFEDGKVVEYDAKEGKDVLESILEGEVQASYLGEVALVPYDSPISNTHLVFGTTLFDENASCHLALGNAYPDCLKDGESMTKDELMENGLNQTKTTHVDFMVGTSDLTIEAITNKGKILIFKNGNFNI